MPPVGRIANRLDRGSECIQLEASDAHAAKAPDANRDVGIDRARQMIGSNESNHRHRPLVAKPYLPHVLLQAVQLALSQREIVE